MKKRTILGLAAGLTFVFATNVRGQTVSIRADQAGTTIYRTGGTNYVGFAGANWGPRVGEYFGQGSVLVLPFQLPTLPVGAQFVTADFQVWLYDITGQTSVPFNVDLYGLAARSTNTVLAADFYASGAPDPGNTLIQAGYLTSTSTNGHGSISISGGVTTPPPIVTGAGGSVALVNYLNTQYNGGAGAGQWIFLRLSPATNTFNGNFAYAPLTSFAGESYAHPLLEYTSSGTTNGVPVQTTNQTINLVFPVQGLAYAKLDIAPAPISVTPIPPEGITAPSVRNPTTPVTYQYTFPPNTTVTVAKNQFTGTEPNTDIQLSTIDYSGQTLTGQIVSTLALDGSTWNVQVYNVAATNTNGVSPLIPDPYQAPAPPPATGSFRLVAPSDQAMITGTRRPVFTWAPVTGAVKYDIYLNISRTDYNWMAPGSLLDRYTLVGTVSAGTTYLLQQDLPDRWTYKWYVIATDGSNVVSRSDLRTFSLYVPNVTTVADGIPIINGMRDLNRDGIIEPYEDWHNPPAVRVADLLSRMTLHEKAMQLFFNAQVYPNAGFAFGPFQASDLFTYQLAAATNRLGIPFLSAGDTVAGYKTTYQTEPGLAATRDLPAIWAVTDVQRRESVAIGYRGTLSPLAEVGTKVLYPRIQEGGGEDADLVAGIIRAMVVGLQGGPEINPQSIMITTKHWPGQGAGGESGIVYDGTTIHYHMRPWHAAIEAGTSVIMPGYAGSILLGPQGFGAGDNPSIIAYLRTNMNYTGVICTDWLPSGDWVRAATAGSDVMGGADPTQMGTFETDVPEARIDEAVSRVLDLKFRMGIFEDPYGSNVNGTVAWHTPQNVALVHQTAVESLTLLKNDGALPLRLPPGSSIVVAGPRADDPSCMVTWRSDFHNNDYGSKTIYQAIVARAAQDGITVYKDAAPAGTNVAAAIVVVGESYYTHGTYWDDNSPYLPDDPIGPPHDTNDAPQYGIIQAFRSNNVPTTTICLLPRPYVLTNVAALSDALMVVYRPGDEGGPAIAETLFGDHLPSGKTPWQLPRGMYQVGDDNSANWSSQPDKWDLPFDLGATPAELSEIRAEIAAGLPVPPTTGDPLFQYGSGLQGFGLTDATAPLAFNLLTPTNGQNVAGAIPPFTWQASSDPETGIARYELYLDGTLIASNRNATTYSLTGTILGNGAHAWYVKAYNWAGGITTSPTFTFTINDVVPPAPFRTLLPTDGTTVNAVNAVVFYWAQTTDSGTGVAEYILRINGGDVATIIPSVYVSPTSNLAIGRTAYGSSTSFGTPGSAVDGDLTTRWSSDWVAVSNADTEWFTVDLGATYSIKEVILTWEAAYGKEFLIQVSNDNSTWTTIYHKTGGTGGTNDLVGLVGAGRYVRMQGVQRGTMYGYSLWEFQVFGSGTEQATVSIPTGTNTWQVRAVDGAGNVTGNSNGSLTIIGPLTPLQQWRQTKFGTLDANDPIGGDAANPAGDGLANLLKYALGLDPLQASSTGLPTVELSNGAYLSLTFTRLKSVTDATYHVEVSSDLKAWNEIWNSLSVPYGGGVNPTQQVTVVDGVPISAAPGGCRFLRLRISRP